jgi:hypothetical protein
MNVNSSTILNDDYLPSNMIKDEMFKPLPIQTNQSAVFISGKQTSIKIKLNLSYKYHETILEILLVIFLFKLY